MPISEETEHKNVAGRMPPPRFTLLEIGIASSIVIVALIFVLKDLMSHKPQTPQRMTEEKMALLASAVMEYQLRNGTPPNVGTWEDEIIQEFPEFKKYATQIGDTHEFRDAWGTPYSLSTHERDPMDYFRLVSDGSNKIHEMGGGDDIVCSSPDFDSFRSASTDKY